MLLFFFFKISQTSVKENGHNKERKKQKPLSDNANSISLVRLHVTANMTQRLF